MDNDSGHAHHVQHMDVDHHGEHSHHMHEATPGYQSNMDNHAGHMHHDHTMMMRHWFSARTHGHVLIENVTVDTITGIVVGMLITCFLTCLYDFLLFSFAVRNKTGQGTLTHFLESLWKLVTVAIGYIIMLLVMTFNYWILLSAILGAGIGYFLCRPIVATWLHKPRSEVKKKDAETRLELLHDFADDRKTESYDEKGVPV